MALCVEDLTEVPNGLRVTIRQSKTDQEGQGAEVAILRGVKLCPVEAVQRWLQMAGITEGTVFRAVWRAGRSMRPSPLRWWHCAPSDMPARPGWIRASSAAIACARASAPRRPSTEHRCSRSWMSRGTSRSTHCAVMFAAPTASRTTPERRWAENRVKRKQVCSRKGGWRERDPRSSRRSGRWP